MKLAEDKWDLIPLYLQSESIHTPQCNMGIEVRSYGPLQLVNKYEVSYIIHVVSEQCRKTIISSKYFFCERANNEKGCLGLFTHNNKYTA